MKGTTRRLALASVGLIGMLTGCDAVSAADGAVEPGLPHALASAGLALGFAVVLALIAAAGRQALIHRQTARRLQRIARPAIVDGHPVMLVPGIGAAMVVGMVQPMIYCADDLAVRLDRDELRALLWHERHHQATRAPLRLIVLAGIERVLGSLFGIRSWLERERAAIEIAADEHAIHGGSSRQVLARTLIKLEASPSPADQASFASAVDLRLMALLGESRPPSTNWSEAILSVASGSIAALILCSAIPTLISAA